MGLAAATSGALIADRWVPSACCDLLAIGNVQTNHIFFFRHHLY